MAKQYYNYPVCVGGTIVAEFAAKARELRNEAERIQALFVATTNDMNNMALLDSPSGSHAAFFNIKEGIDSGANFYTAVMAVVNPVLSVTETQLAALDNG